MYLVYIWNQQPFIGSPVFLLHTQNRHRFFIIKHKCCSSFKSGPCALQFVKPSLNGVCRKIAITTVHHYSPCSKNHVKTPIMANAFYCTSTITGRKSPNFQTICASVFADWSWGRQHLKSSTLTKIDTENITYARKKNVLTLKNFFFLSTYTIWLPFVFLFRWIPVNCTVQLLY